MPISWEGGESEFHLGMREFRALQDAVDFGPEAILARLAARQYRVDEVTETLRLGLIGAGMDKAEASRRVILAEQTVGCGALRATAFEVLMQNLYRGEPSEGEVPEKTMAAETPEADGTSPPSMETPS